MPVKNDFKTCTHVQGDRQIDWRECYACLDELAVQLQIARTYLKEIAEGVFNDDGVMQHPVQEPVQGQSYSRIAKTALGICS